VANLENEEQQLQRKLQNKVLFPELETFTTSLGRNSLFGLPSTLRLLQTNVVNKAFKELTKLFP